MGKTLRKENRKSVPKTVKKESKIKQRSEEREIINRAIKELDFTLNAGYTISEEKE